MTASRSGLPRRFKRSALSNYANAVVSLVLAILVTPLLVRGLGKEAYGTWAIVTSSVVYFNLLQFGLGRATIKFVAGAQAVGDLGRVRRIVSTSIAALSIPGCLLVLLSPLLAFAIPELFHLKGELRTAAMVVTVLSAIDLAVAIPADTLGATLAGFQRYELLNATVVATALAQAAAWAAIIGLGGGLIGIGVATVSFSLASQVVRYLLVGHLVGGPPFRRRQIDRSLLRPILTFSGWIAVADLSATIISKVDVFVVGLVVGVPQAAVYAVGQKLAVMTSRFTDPVVTMFYPHAAELAALQDREGLRATVRTGLRLSTAISLPLTVMLCVLARPAIRVWVGNGYGGAAWVVVFLSLSAFAFSIDRIAVYVLRGLGEVKLPAILGGIEAALNLGLSVGLGLTIGLVGVAVGTLAAHVATSFCVALPYIFRRVEISLRSVVWMLVRGYSVPAAVELLVGLVLLHLGVHGFLKLAGAGTAMFLAFVLAALVFAVSRSERQRLLGRVLQRRGVSLASR
ncbi:MAG: lipopolysaccharide biosynthesis protein [Gaiellaceae bacterium]